MNIKILVAAHKKYDMPTDSIYLPMQVGAEGKEAIDGFMPDNLGENISNKNDRYCELTGLYYAWKNLDYDALGLAHYRRHFTMKNKSFRRRHTFTECVLTGEEAEDLLKEYDIIAPAKRRYYIESLYSHYAHTHYAEHLDQALKVIYDRCPEYVDAVRTVYSRSWGYMFNMFLMKKEYVDDYCNWLFPILEDLESRIDLSGLTPFERRLFGRVSEILFNAWLLEKQKEGAKVTEVKFMSTEKVNWWKKGTSFLNAKLTGKGYKESFQ